MFLLPPPPLSDEAQVWVRDWLGPENPTETLIATQADWLQGVFWGKPRRGHPEGLVLYHIAEVLANVERCQGPYSVWRNELRILAFCHDTFKYREDLSQPRNWSRHHGVLAAEFMHKLQLPNLICKLAQWHDEAYYIWRNLKQGQEAKAGSRLNQLWETLGSELPLFYAFFCCDTLTGDKDLKPLFWFEDLVGLPRPLSFEIQGLNRPKQA